MWQDSSSTSIPTSFCINYLLTSFYGQKAQTCSVYPLQRGAFPCTHISNILVHFYWISVLVSMYFSLLFSRFLFFLPKRKRQQQQNFYHVLTVECPKRFDPFMPHAVTSSPARNLSALLALPCYHCFLARWLTVKSG